MVESAQHSRPAPLHRARSQSQGDAVPPVSIDSVSRPSRPQHVRSHSHFGGTSLSQDAPSKPLISLERVEKTAAEKTYRIHLPGRQHTEKRNSLDNDTQRRRSKLHRYTQSLADHHHHTNSHAYHTTAMMRKRRTDLGDSANHDSLPNLVAGLNAERNRAHHGRGPNDSPADSLPSASTANSKSPGLHRVRSTRSYRGTAADAFGPSYDPQPATGRPYDLRHRATSDPRMTYDSFGNPLRLKTSVELDLERADRLARQHRFTITAADIQRQDTEIAAAEDELRENLQQIHHTGTELTRRLDYGFYNLLEKVGGLASVIHSFQTLATQSRQLVTNLEHETDKTDEHIRARAAKLQEDFNEREKRIVELEERQRAVQMKAKALGDRLERARLRVQKWERTQLEKQQIWGRFWGRVRWCSVLGTLVLFLAVMLAKGFVWRHGSADTSISGAIKAKANDNGGVGVRDALGALLESAAPLIPSILGAGNYTNPAMSSAIDRVPDDVKSILLDIEDRKRSRPSSRLHPAVVEAIKDDAAAAEKETREKEPAPLRVLDEL